MKKRTSKLMCLVLTVLLVACMTVPVMAGTGKHGQYDYTWTVTKTETSGRAAITTPYVPTTVGAAVKNRVYDSASGVFGYSYSSGSSSSEMVPVTGYASASATASNVFTEDSRVHSGEVLETIGTFWINSTRVISSAWAD